MRTGQVADPETTKAPRRARYQRELREGIGSDHTKETGVKVTEHRLPEPRRGGRCAGEKSSDRNSNNNGRHWFLLSTSFYIHY